MTRPSRDLSATAELLVLHVLVNDYWTLSFNTVGIQ